MSSMTFQIPDILIQDQQKMNDLKEHDVKVGKNWEFEEIYSNSVGPKLAMAGCWPTNIETIHQNMEI